MRLVAICILLSTFIITSCAGGYSLSGASIPPGTSSISIQSFPNRASLVQPQLSQLLSDALRNRFLSRTSLKVITVDGDLDIKGEIVNYSIAPIAIQSNDQAGMNRLTITIRVKFTNKKDPKSNYDQTFSRFRDYSSSLNFADVELELIGFINEDLIDEIFNKAVANW